MLKLPWYIPQVKTNKMATQSLVKDVVNEEKFIDLWPDHPCMYDVRSPEFKNRDKREKAVTEMSEKLEQTGMLNSETFNIFFH